MLHMRLYKTQLAPVASGQGGPVRSGPVRSVPIWPLAN